MPYKKYRNKENNGNRNDHNTLKKTIVQNRPLKLSSKTSKKYFLNKHHTKDKTQDHPRTKQRESIVQKIKVSDDFNLMQNF